MNIVYSPRALRDLEGIAACIIERSPSGAPNVLAAIKSSIDALAAFPEIGRIVDSAEHRRLPVLRYPYAIFYRIGGDELLILHIRHTSRHPLDPATNLND
jgi:plasmid stabilization system protein ParE